MTFIGVTFFSFSNQNTRRKSRQKKEQELILDSVILIKEDQWNEYLHNPNNHPLRSFGIPLGYYCV